MVQLTAEALDTLQFLALFEVDGGRGGRNEELLHRARGCRGVDLGNLHTSLIACRKPNDDRLKLPTRAAQGTPHIQQHGDARLPDFGLEIVVIDVDRQDPGFLGTEQFRENSHVYLTR